MLGMTCLWKQHLVHQILTKHVGFVLIFFCGFSLFFTSCNRFVLGAWKTHSQGILLLERWHGGPLFCSSLDAILSMQSVLWFLLGFNRKKQCCSEHWQFDAKSAMEVDNFNPDPSWSITLVSGTWIRQKPSIVWPAAPGPSWDATRHHTIMSHRCIGWWNASCILWNAGLLWWHDSISDEFTRSCLGAGAKFRFVRGNFNYAPFGPQTESEPHLAIPRAGFPYQGGTVSNLVCLCDMVDVQASFVPPFTWAEVECTSTCCVLLGIGCFLERFQPEPACEDAATCGQRNYMALPAAFSMLPMAGCTLPFSKAIAFQSKAKNALLFTHGRPPWSDTTLSTSLVHFRRWGFHGQNPQDCGFLPWKDIHAFMGKAICLEKSTAVVRDEEKVFAWNVCNANLSLNSFMCGFLNMNLCFRAFIRCLVRAPWCGNVLKPANRKRKCEVWSFFLCDAGQMWLSCKDAVYDTLADQDALHA